MDNLEFPVVLLPKAVRNQAKFKRYKRGDFIFEQGNNKVFYMKEGTAVKVRCDEDGEKTYPYMFSDDEFIGVNAYFTGRSNWDWEVIASSDEVIGYEMSYATFKEYILSTPIFTQQYLPKCTKLLFQGLRGFYIYSQGGATAYYAYILNCFCENSNVFHFDSYTELTKTIYVNKSTLYKITNQFIEEGIIEKNKHSIKILDREALIGHFENYKY